jgi:hypothetical protein
VKPRDVHRLLDEVLKARGAEQVVAVLEGLRNNNLLEPTVLTIIANAGVHEIPQLYLRGDVYEASRGDWDASTEEALLLDLKAILSRLAGKLRSRRWTSVYLIPTGHPILSLQIKAMVYRLLRFNTIDLYHKAGTYFEVNLDQRAIALDTGDRVDS